MKVSSMICLALLITVSYSRAQEKVQQLPLNKSVRYGRLDNGFQYYILKNDKGAKEIMMSLVVNAGNYDEKPNEKQTAHFIEHLAFRTTSNFPNGMRQHFNSKGIRPAGATVDQTIYEITIPSDNSDLIYEAILGLHDCAGGILFLPADVEEERSAVYREATNAQVPTMFAMKDAVFKQLDKNPLYHHDISKQMTIINRLQREDLIRFYNTWYRPIHETLFIVGDVSVDKMEELIRKNFSSLSNTGAGKKTDIQKLYDVPLSGKSKLVVVDHGKTNRLIQIDLVKKQKTVLDGKTLSNSNQYKFEWFDALFREMMSHRLVVMAKTNVLYQPMMGYINRKAIHSFAQLDAITMQTTITDVIHIDSIAIKMLEELRKIEQHGFTVAEFELAKSKLLSSLTNSQVDNSTALMIKMANYHFGRGAFPENEAALKENILRELTVEEVNRLITTWLQSDGNFDLVLSVPNMQDKDLPTESQVLGWIEHVRKKDIEPYVEPVVKAWPEKPRVSNTSFTREEIPGGITRIKLSNGMTVVLKPLQTEGGMVTLYATKKNTGKEIQDFYLAFSPIMGVGLLRVADVRELTQDKNNFWINPYVSKGEWIIEGYADQSDEESLLRLMNLYMVNALLDTAALTKQNNSVKNLSRKKAFSIRTGSQLFADSIRASSGSLSVVAIDYNPPYLTEQMTKEVIQKYKVNFGDASEFTVVLSGNFEIENMIPLVSRYLGSLPGSIKRKDQTKHAQESSIKTDKRKSHNSFKPGLMTTLVGDSVNNTHVRILLRGTSTLNKRDRMVLDIMNSTFRKILFIRLREREKGIYDVSSNILFNQDQQEFFLDVDFETAPWDVDRLVAATRDELQHLANGQLDDSVFQYAFNHIHTTLAGGMRSTYFWTQYILDQERSGGYDQTDLKQLEILNSITKADIIRAARECLNPKDYMVFKLL